MNDAPVGPSFDDFLAEEGLLDEATARAMKDVLAQQLDQKVKAPKLIKATGAEGTDTRRTQLDQ